MSYKARYKYSKYKDQDQREQALTQRLKELEIQEKQRAIYGLGSAYDSDMQNISRDMRDLAARLAKLENPQPPASD